MKKKYENLEIICEGNKVHTGADVGVVCDGENICSKYDLTRLKWRITPDGGTINMWHCKNTKTSELFFDKEKDTIDEKKLTIKYPVKKIHFDFKRFSIISNNTSLGTKFYIDGEEFKNSGIIETTVYVGDADTINEVSIITC